MARSLGWVSTIVVMATLGLGCSGGVAPSASAPGQGGLPGGRTAPTRVVGVVRGEPFGLTTAINEAGSGSVAGIDEVEMLLNAGLSARDPQGILRARLAEQVPSIDNGSWAVNPDGTMRTTWHLRPDLAWQDGAPFTANDLVFSIASI